MRLILLPLTYKDEEKKQETIKLCVNLAQKIPDKEQETFALAGILAFTDKIISNSTKKYIEEVLGMTQVGQMLMDKGRKEGTITLLFDLYNDGDITLHKAASKSGMSEEDFLKAAKSILEK